MNQEILYEEINEFIDDKGVKNIERKIYIKIDDNKWKAQKKYYENNKNDIIKHIVEYKKNRYNTDEVYREKIKANRRESYSKKKTLKLENII